MSDIAGAVYQFILRYGYLALFLATALEGTGLPGPIQIAFFAAGYMIGRGEMDLAMVVITAALGNLAGNAAGYAIGAIGGRAFIKRWGRYFRIGEQQLDQIEGWFTRYGSLTAFVARIFGIIRTPTILGAGIARMRLGLFLLFSGLGDLVWSTFWTYLGLLWGSRAGDLAVMLLKALTTPSPQIAVAIFLAALPFLAVVFLRAYLRAGH
ncbi:MAG TPA: DedA family protein [Firmicutes bacterium]|nr:DedA family protein [Bacillota bacterium]